MRCKDFFIVLLMLLQGGGHLLNVSREGKERTLRVISLRLKKGCLAVRFWHLESFLYICTINDRAPLHTL